MDEADRSARETTTGEAVTATSGEGSGEPGPPDREPGGEPQEHAEPGDDSGWLPP